MGSELAADDPPRTSQSLILVAFRGLVVLQTVDFGIHGGWGGLDLAAKAQHVHLGGGANISVVECIDCSSCCLAFPSKIG